MNLGVAILFAERGVCAKCLHLLEAIGKDGLDLRHLIVAQPQPLSQMRSLLVGIEVTMDVPRLALRSWSLIGSGSLCKHDPRGEKRAQNQRSFSYIANSVHTLNL